MGSFSPSFLRSPASGAAIALVSANANGNPPPRGDVVVFVTSQGLYYDSIVNAPLPPLGPFQLLVMGGAESGATPAGSSVEDLRIVVQAWPKLRRELRDGIVAIVQAAQS